MFASRINPKDELAFIHGFNSDFILVASFKWFVKSFQSFFEMYMVFPSILALVVLLVLSNILCGD